MSEMTPERLEAMRRLAADGFSPATAQEAVAEIDHLRTALAASEQEVEQYRQVIQAGRRLPDPDLSQDPAYAAFVLGKLEQARAELVAWVEKVKVAIFDATRTYTSANDWPGERKVSLTALDRLAALLAKHAPETPK